MPSPYKCAPRFDDPSDTAIDKIAFCTDWKRAVFVNVRPRFGHVTGNNSVVASFPGLPVQLQCKTWYTCYAMLISGMPTQEVSAILMAVGTGTVHVSALNSMAGLLDQQVQFTMVAQALAVSLPYVC